MAMSIPVLPLENMHERHHGLTKPIADAYREAASVCLGKHHVAPQEFSLRAGATENRILVQWQSPDARCQAAWANETDTTEQGAYGCALAAIELSLGLLAARRAETLSGADYYVAPAGSAPDDLENCYRLEVSGTNLGGSEVAQRLRDKARQAQEGKSSLPALAAVVGFKVKLIAMRFVEEEP